MNQEFLRKDRPLFGHLLESFVFQEFRRLASFAAHLHRFHHFRDKEKKEVDVVIERDGTSVAGLEAKASSTVLPKDFSGLIKLRDAMGERFVQGVVLYDGENVRPFGDRLYADPVASLWS
ncbi:MAG: DUF4143 domain-containing protein [Bacteroidetes bacterium]|nr:DUF4143 domain-containing protein [Bacteroidota bacterium]